MRNSAATFAMAILLGAAPAGAQVGSVYGTSLAPVHPNGNSSQFDAARAQRNYEAVQRGQKTWQQLSQQELSEVQALDLAARARLDADKRSPRQKCLDQEIKHSGGSPSELELRVIDLKCSQH